MGQSRAWCARLTAADDGAAGWSRLHSGLDPRANRLLWGWLRAMWWLARPLTPVPPTLITALGAALAVGAALTSLPWLALILVLASVVCDGLDGAVAVLNDRATRQGAIADKTADRIADVAFAAVIWQCGAPVWLAVLAAVAMLGVEGLRELGRAPVMITVGERPSRVICAVLACACAEATASSWPATTCAAVSVGLSVIACAQLATAARAS